LLLRGVLLCFCVVSFCFVSVGCVFSVAHQPTEKKRKEKRDRRTTERQQQQTNRRRAALTDFAQDVAARVLVKLGVDDDGALLFVLWAGFGRVRL
jgi:hypothetical protein